MRTHKLTALIVVGAIVMASQVYAQIQQQQPGHYNVPGQYTPVGGQTMHYTSYDVNADGSTTLHLTNGLTYTIPAPKEDQPLRNTSS